MIVEFELVKREPDKVIKRLVHDTYREGYNRFPNEVEELLKEGFVIADNRLIEETDTVPDLKLYLVMFAVHKGHEYYAYADHVFAYNEDRAIDSLKKRYGEETRVRFIEEVPYKEGTMLYGDRWDKL